MKLLQAVSWIIFIGVCIEAGGFLINTILSLVTEPSTAKHFWQQADLSALRSYDTVYFALLGFFVCAVAVLRAIMFYHIVTLFQNRTIDIANPFSPDMRRFTVKLAYLSLFTGLLSWMAARQVAWIASKAIAVPTLEVLRVAGADVWLFMGVVLLIMAQFFKRGEELQLENQFTV